MRKNIPHILWFGIFSAGMMIGLKIAASIIISPWIVLGAVLTALILYGIVRGNKWAYYLIIITCITGTINRGFMLGAEIGIFNLLDCLVLVPVLMSRDYFFPSEGNTHILSPPLHQREG